MDDIEVEREILSGGNVGSSAGTAVEMFLSDFRISNRSMDRENGKYSISTAKERLQLDVIQKFLEEDSYWAQDRRAEQTRLAIENSVCFGLYHDGNQIGFARVVSDFATFAYLGDVFVLEAFRGRGLSKWLMETIISHPDLQGLRRWVLATRDAHTLYEKYGFHALKFPGRWMEKPAPDAY
ncbi:MAG: GNAT family N-acetyltransferase [Pyrinomonadaceae bacterium]